MSANTEHNRPRSEYSTSDLGELLSYKLLGTNISILTGILIMGTCSHRHYK